MSDKYRPGDYYLFCAATGFKIPRSEAVRRYDGAWVHKDYCDVQHPVEHPREPSKARPVYPTRPKPAAVFVASSDVMFSDSPSIVARSGSYSVTGTAVEFVQASLNKVIVADAGSYVITGTDASLEHGWEVVAGAGSYAVTGTDASLEHGWEVVAGAGSYAVTGSDVTLTPGSGVVGGEALVEGETDAMGIDFTYDDDRSKQMHVITSSVGVDSDPYTNLTYTSPSIKLCRQSDGVWRYGSHNLFLNSASPADQSVTVVSGGTYAVVITGATTTTLSDAATGSISAGTTNFTAASTTLTFGSTSGAGTVAVYRTPSVGTYLATTAAARYDLPYEWNAAGDPLGILIEEERTNQVLSNRAFSTASWAKDNTTVADNDTTAPDGTTTATKMTASAGNTEHRVYQDTGVSDDRTTSVFAKAGTVNFISLTNSGLMTDGATFNLSNGTVFATGGGASNATITDAGNGWYRCSVYSALSAPYCIIVMGDTGAHAEPNTTWNAAGTETVYLWQPQSEASATFPTSPIHTIGATVTRAVDQIKILTSAYPHSATVGTVVCKALYRSANHSVAGRFFEVNDNTTNETIQVFRQTGGDPDGIGYNFIDGGVSQGTVSPLTATFNSATPNKVAISWASNDVAVVANGGTVATDTSATLPTMTQLQIGNGSGTDRAFEGYIQQITYLSRAASDAEIITLTT